MHETAHDAGALCACAAYSPEIAVGDPADGIHGDGDLLANAFQKIQPSPRQPFFAISQKDVTGCDIRAAKVLGLQRVFHTVTGSANGLKVLFLGRGHCAQEMQRKVDSVCTQFYGHIHKTMEDTGNAVRVADCYNLLCQMFIFRF